MERTLNALIGVLHQYDPDASAEHIADSIWLAARMMPEIEGSEIEGSVEPPAARGLEQKPEEIQKPEPQTPPRPTVPTPPQAGSSGLPQTQHPQDTLSQASVELQTTSVGRESTTGALPFRTPSGRALPRPLDITRALRPLIRRVPTPDSPPLLDVEASIRRAIDSKIWLPVFRPQALPWLELALVIDESPSMRIWHDTIHELYYILACQGAFREVQLWHLRTNVRTDEVRLYFGANSTRRHYKEIINPARRRIILIVTDCVSPGWQGEDLITWLRAWGREHTVSLMQMLPQRLWSRSRLGSASLLAVRALGGAVPNTMLRRLERPPKWLKEFTYELSPILLTTLEPDLLADWAKFISGNPDPTLPAFIFHSNAADDITDPLASNVEIRFEQFRANASELAFKLGCFLAAAPLRLPVMRLIQNVLVPESDQTHMAEFFLSGLIKRVYTSVSSGADKLLCDIDPDQIEYDFLSDDVRRKFLKAGTVTDALQALQEVSNYIVKHEGGINVFQAAINDPDALDYAAIPQGCQTFAKVTSAVLLLLGPSYRALAARLSPELNKKEGIGTLPSLAANAAQSHIQDPVTPPSSSAYKYYASSRLLQPFQPSSRFAYNENFKNNLQWNKADTKSVLSGNVLMKFGRLVSHNDRDVAGLAISTVQKRLRADRPS